MKQREQPSAPRGALALPCLAVFLLPILAVSSAECGPGLPPQIPVVQPRSYLSIVGAPPLRFLEPALPPEPIPQPSSAEPARVTNDANASDPAHDVTLQVGTQAEPSSRSPVASNLNDNASTDESAQVRTPLPIIPDDVRPRVRPEDFLPYFRIPIVKPDDMNGVPVPRSASAGAALPTSSATYTQTPR